MEWCSERTGKAVLSPQWLDELRARVTLSGVIQRTVKLQRAGHEANGLDFSLSKYAANCHLNFRWNRGAIAAAVLGRAERSAA